MKIETLCLFFIVKNEHLKDFFRIMRISIFLLFVCALQVIAMNTNAQNAVIRIDANKITVGELFKEIEKQTDYLVVFRNREVDTERQMDVSKKSATVASYLNEVFADTEIDYQFEKNYIVLSTKQTPAPAVPDSRQAGRQITGVIQDQHGEPVIGANIVIKGTTTGTVTNIDGEYTLQVPENATLQITYIGYLPKEIKVSNQSVINIELIEDTQKLDEVVVVGYGTVKKANLTGAVDQISSKVLENRPVSNVAQALQGVVGNLNVSSASGGGVGTKQSINIRGYTGFDVSGSPLIVIDGVQVSNMDDINPNDIESISILKDAASSAIYGSSAPYGAIIITTKRGQTGTAPRITYSNNFRFAQPINLPKMSNSLYFAETINEACKNANIGNIIRDETIQRIKDYQAGLITDETIKRAGVDEWEEFPQGNANYDWFDIHFKDYSFSQQHNIGVAGGSSNSAYYIGLGYNSQSGLYEFGDDSYKRYNVRTNLSSSITKWLTVSVRSALSRGISDKPYWDNAHMQRIGGKFPNGALKTPYGDYTAYSDVLKLKDGGRNKLREDKVVLTGELVINPLKGWDITFNYTFDGVYNNGQNHSAIVYEVRPSKQSVALSETIPNTYAVYNQRWENQVVNAFTSYEHTWGEHYVKGLIGYTQEVRDHKNINAEVNNLFNDYNPSLSLSYGTSKNSDEMRQLAIRGGFGRINYSYKEKYLVELNARYDGSSRFLSDVRYRFYPGASAAWVVSNESFWVKPLRGIVNTFKLRASYGSLGDQSFLYDWYPFYPSMPSSAPTSANWIFADGRDAYLNNPGIINNKLTWITTNTFDLGFDMYLFANRMSASFDWYRRKSKDYVGPSEALPAVLGAQAPSANNASMETKGFELSLLWRDMIGSVGYHVKATLSDYKGKVLKYPNPTKDLSVWREGQTMGEIWGYETYGLFQTEEEVKNASSQAKLSALQWTPGDVRYVDRNNDGVIDFGENTETNPGDRTVIGNSTPRYAYGITIGADYKGFDFSAFMEGIGKRDAWIDENSSFFWGINGGAWSSAVMTVHHDRWTPDNPNGYYPKYYMSRQMSKNTQTQTRYLQNAAYMRIKNMQLGYSLPDSFINRYNLSKVRFYVSVENLATFTNFTSVMDPEFATSNGAIYPLQRTWSCGINVTF